MDMQISPQPFCWMCEECLKGMNVQPGKKTQWGYVTVLVAFLKMCLIQEELNVRV